MSKIPCDVIKDLLPLYEDDVCSERSKDMIEEHLTDCEDCRDYLEAIHEELPPMENPDIGSSVDEDIKFVKNVCRKISFHQIIIFAVLLLVVLTFSVLSEYADYNESLENFPLLDKRISVENVQVTDLYQLENGNIYCTLKSRPSFTSFWCHLDLPDSKTSEYYDKAKSIITFRRSLRDIMTKPETLNSKVSIVFSMKETAYFDNDEKLPVIHKSNSIFYEGKGGKRLLIWKKGNPIKKAPAKIEQRVEDSENGDPDYSLFIFDGGTE